MMETVIVRMYVRGFICIKRVGMGRCECMSVCRCVRTGCVYLTVWVCVRMNVSERESVFIVCEEVWV